MKSTKLFYEMSLKIQRIILAMICLLTGIHIYAQPQPQAIDLSSHNLIIRESETPKRVEITNNNNEKRYVELNISDINQIQNYKTAVVENGKKPVPYISKGTIAGGRRLTGSVLPAIYIERPNNANEPIVFQVLIDTIRPLTYNPENNNYKGRFSIILLDDSNPSLTRKNLSTPVLFEITSGTNASLQPENLTINHTNLPSTEIEISENSQKNPVPVKIKTSFKPSGYQTFLNKENRIIIEPGFKKLQGMGVQTQKINIFLQNNITDTVNLSLTVDKGNIEPNTMKLTSNDIGTAHLTTEGTGRCKLTISAAGITSSAQSYQFIFPWVFILCAFLGSAVGALLKIKLIDKEEIKFSNFSLCLLIGIAFSIVYYVLGIDIFPMKLARTMNEFFVFGIGFLSALFWKKIYDFLAGLFGK